MRYFKISIYLALTLTVLVIAMLTFCYFNLPEYVTKESGLQFSRMTWALLNLVLILSVSDFIWLGIGFPVYLAIKSGEFTKVTDGLPAYWRTSEEKKKEYGYRCSSVFILMMGVFFKLMFAFTPWNEFFANTSEFTYLHFTRSLEGYSLIGMLLGILIFFYFACFRKVPDIIILKLFKITDEESAKEFNTEKLIFQTIQEFESVTEVKPNGFNLNYTKDYKSLDGYKKALAEIPENVYSFISFDADNTDTYFSVSNAMLNLNYEKKPKNSSIDFSVQISDKIANLEFLENLAKNLIEKYDFEYGYIQTLPNDYNDVTERQVQKGFFGDSVDVNELDHIWTFHKVGILHGYLKKVYQINYLNKSQTDNPVVKYGIDEAGTIDNINSKITKWTLNNEELRTARDLDTLSRMLIISDYMEFLKTDDAKQFKALMEA